jgi:mannose-6-phosphate isomerase-like protein (cupin superfamily)
MEANNAIRIVRREESLRSVQKAGTRIRLLYENEWAELLSTEVEPGNSIGSGEFWDFEAVHFVVEGGLLLHNSGSSILLLPGDSITMGRGKKYRISNTTSSRAVIWSLLFKRPEQVFDPEAQTRREKNGGGL